MDETLDLIWWRIYCICCLCKCALCIECTHTIQNWQWMKLYLSYISTDNWREGFIVFFAVGSPFASFASHLILICGTAVVSLKAKYIFMLTWPPGLFREPADELHGVQPAGAVLHLHQPAALRLLQPEHPGGPPPARRRPPGQDPRRRDQPRALARPPRRLEAEERVHHKHQARRQHQGKWFGNFTLNI